jgi:hypothetical protein
MAEAALVSPVLRDPAGQPPAGGPAAAVQCSVLFGASWLLRRSGRFVVRGLAGYGATMTGAPFPGGDRR